MGKKWKQWQFLFSWAPKSLQMVTAAIKLKDASSLEEKLWQTQHIKTQRHHFANKGPYSQSYGFSSGHVWMWELDHKEGRAPKNWYFQTVVLEKILESPLDCKEINLSILKEINPDYSLEGLMLKVKLQYFGHLMRRADSLEKTLMLGKTEGRRSEMVGCHHRFNRNESEQTLGDSGGQRSLACCSPGGHRVRDDLATEQQQREERKKERRKMVPKDRRSKLPEGVVFQRTSVSRVRLNTMWSSD